LDKIDFIGKVVDKTNDLEEGLKKLEAKVDKL
jgi:hypothetical protein